MWTTLISSALGSLSGILGHWFKAKEEREKREHDLKLRKLEMEMRKQDHEHAMAEIDANIKVAEVTTEGQLLIQEAKGFNEAVAEINKNLIPTSVLEKLLNGGWVARFFGSFVAIQLAQVDVIRGLIRPILTIASFTAIGWLAYTFAPVFVAIPTLEQKAVMMMVIDAVVYVLTAATQFWFMDRAGARDFRKKH